MAGRDPAVALRQMLDHAREALDLARGRTRSELDSDRMLNLSLVRLLEILGEAAARVPPEERTKHPGIPWMQIAALRNRLIHAYDEVDFDVLWQIVTEDLPPLVSALGRILRPGGKG
ncbi:MAG: HepT-like ribonuclease domain-containing protein [Planctomycetota bacterium]